MPRSVTKPDGRIITLARRSEIKQLWRAGALTLDVRDQTEVDASKGGRSSACTLHVPINVEGKPQSAHATTLTEWTSKLRAAGVNIERPSTAFVVHCTGGGRAEKAVMMLQKLGFTAVNGGGPDDVRRCFEEAARAHSLAP